MIQEVVFTMSDVLRYRSLESIHLFNDFSSIDATALDTLTNLSWLHLEDTLIKFLPDNLLDHNKKFTNLQLKQNLFAGIPFNIFSADSKKYVTSISFHGHLNASLPCINDTLALPSELGQFCALQNFDFGYNKFETDSCSSQIFDAFFKPISNVSVMSIEGTSLLYRKENAMKVLNELKEFDISSLWPYQKCPAEAYALFNNIPVTVRKLDVTHWETGTEIEEKCLITNKTVLSGLSKLKQLNEISFGYGDGIFGSEFKRTTMPKIPALTTLDLSYCRLSYISKDSFLNFPNLRTLNIAGNPLGPKDIDFTSRAMPTLHYLSLRDTSIRSDMYLFYDASNPICNFPNVGTIDFSSNDLRRLPRFYGSSVCNLTKSTTVEAIFASDNRIEEFIARNGTGADNICIRFPNLKHLKLDKNIIESLHGLEKCRELEKLNVDQNHLFYNRLRSNSLATVLKDLTHLTWLSIGSNGLHKLIPSLLYNMPNLTRFYSAWNKIQSLDEQFFSKNSLLQTVDLHDNYLQHLHHDLFEHLLLLEYLDLRGNLISVFSPDFLHMLNSFKSLSFFGFGNNPYDCRCNKAYFKTWLINHPYYMGSGINFIKCDTPANLQGTRVIDYKNDLYECTIKTVLIIGGGVLAGFLLTLVIALPCYKYRWYVRHAKLVWKAFTGSMEYVKLEETLPYDAFVSYDPRCEADCLWVVEELRQAIEDEDQSRFKFYLEHRDSLSGTNRYTEREIALRNSKRILIVVSNSYLRSADCLSEADLSGLLMHGTEFYQPNRVLLLIREHLSEEIIRPPMSSLLLGKTLKVEYDPGRKAIMWGKIREFLSKPLYTYCRREDLATRASASSPGSYDNDDTIDPSSDSRPLLSTNNSDN